MRDLDECPAPLFFFQAEDGIRDLYVTGVQTCALPILSSQCLTEAMAPTHWWYSQSGGITASACWIREKIGRASCRERAYIPVVAVPLQRNHGFEHVPPLCALLNCT